MRELAKEYSWVTRILHVGAAAVVLTLSGPFGTYTAFGLFERFQFWVVSLAVAGVFIHSIVYFSLLLASQSRRMAVMAVMVGTMFASVPAAAAIMEVYAYFNEIQIAPDRYPTIWSNVTVIGFVVAMIQFWPQIRNAGQSAEAETENLQVTEPSPVPEPAEKFNVPLLARLPNCVEPNKIVSFSMQDHYVEVMTIKGPHMLLMRFTDAIALLGDLKRCTCSPLTLGVEHAYGEARETGP